jgi:DNA-binding NarL/FixJ family response regulator
MKTRTKIRIVLADDHKLFQEGLAALLRSRGMEVIGQAPNGEEAILMARELDPDIILMDLELPEVNGIVATQIIKRHMPSIKILMLSAYGENDKVYEAMKAGASAFVVKRTNTEDLVKIIKACCNGEVFVSPYLASLALSEGMRANDNERIGSEDLPDALSSQEQKILNLIVNGSSNDQIAKAMKISRNTVKAYLKSVFKKLRVENRSQAAAAAVEKRLLTPSPPIA